ncbi:MAG TPA: zinc-binding dehydrogenase [Stellaceae bacterium]|nr:zinc-binding dehydrogenase [Stellaceae bacterium]
MAPPMRQIWITRHGPPEVLALREAAVPSPGAGEVLIAVAAAGVNFADIMARRGVYPDAPKPPCVVGYEVAGEVAALGPGAEQFALGQKVAALTRFGGYASHVAVPESQVFALPAGLDAAQGAALPLTYLTAYALVIALGRLGKGETVLIHSAGGGVGLSAIELAQIAGAEVIGVASAAKHDFLRRRGVRLLVDARAGDLAAQVKALTAGRGVDLALDPIGGRSWRQSLDCLAPLGRLGAFGFAAAAERQGRFLPLLRAAAGVPWLRFTPPALMNANLGVFGVNLGRLWGETATLRRWLADILRWQAEGKINPVVDRSFAFAEAAAAHAHIEARRNIGKVLLVP